MPSVSLWYIHGSQWSSGLGICLARGRSWVRFPRRQIPRFFLLGCLLCKSWLMLSKFNCNTLGWSTVPFVFKVMTVHTQFDGSIFYMHMLNYSPGNILYTALCVTCISKNLTRLWLFIHNLMAVSSICICWIIVHTMHMHKTSNYLSFLD